VNCSKLSSPFRSCRSFRSDADQHQNENQDPDPNQNDKDVKIDCKKFQKSYCIVNSITETFKKFSSFVATGHLTKKYNILYLPQSTENKLMLSP
jgi:hypothetical protein